VGLGATDDDTVFRRSGSGRVLTECLARANSQRLLSADVILRWGDAIATWLIRERDTRAYVPGKGWAHALAYGADAIGELARSPLLGTTELTVLLDVLADRVLTDGAPPLVSGELDRIAGACRSIVLRGLVPLAVVEPWLARIAAHATPTGVTSEVDPYVATYNAQTFLRNLHLHLELGRPAVPHRADLLLTVVEALRASNPFSFGLGD
jgi:hypothetical protein